MENKNDKLTDRVVRGGLWVFALRFFHQILYLGRLFVLAYLLAPQDFGMMGVALLTIASLETFSKTGFQQALIQKKDETEKYLDSVWTILVLRGVFLLVLLVIVAPYVAAFFKVQEAKLLIQVLGLSFLLRSFTNIGVIYFSKELDFKKQFIYQSTGTVADFFVAISAALILRNAWALVFGYLAGDFVRLIISYLIHPYRPKFSFEFRKAGKLFDFGKWILSSNVLIFLVIHGDDAFIGRFLGAAFLGFYQMAYRISNVPTSEVTNVVSDVMFPAYSKIQDDLLRFKNMYLRVVNYTSFFTFPLAGLILVFAQDFTRLVLTEKWMPMVQALQILAIYGLISCFNSSFVSVFYAAGKPSKLAKVVFVQLIFLAAIIYPLTDKWGIAGTAIAVTLANVLCFILCMFEIKKMLNVHFLEFFNQLKKHAIASSVVIFVIVVLKSMLGTLSLWTLIFLLVIFCIFYASYGRKMLLSIIGLIKSVYLTRMTEINV